MITDTHTGPPALLFPCADAEAVLRLPLWLQVVLATSIAETSITIDDVVFVVDCGKVKLQAYDALNKLAILAPVWVSKVLSWPHYAASSLMQPVLCRFRVWGSVLMVKSSC